MKTPRLPTVLLLGSLALASSLQAETLVQYAFTSNATSATISGTNVTTQSMTRGAGFTVTRSSVTGAGSPLGSIYVLGSQVDETISVTSTDWLGFTITAGSGYELDLSSLSFDYAFTYNGGIPPVSATFDVRSNVLGYDTSIGSVSPAAVDIATNPIWLSASIGLTAGVYQNLGAITFRIYLNDGANASGTSFLRLDTLTLTGVAATPIPEPSTYVLLAGLCGLAFVGVRRRRRVS